VFDTGPSGSAEYTITSSAAPGSKISPLGKISVPRGADQTFSFSAEEGYALAWVNVDGTYLTPEQMALGTYTFRDVSSNHTISVAADYARDLISLTIKVMEGKGRAEYSVGGADYVGYSTTVYLPYNADVFLRAYADDGYTFREWRAGERSYAVSDVQFGDVKAPLVAHLYFEDNDNNLLWWILGTVLLLIAGLLIWFLFFRRSSSIIVTAKLHTDGIGIAGVTIEYTWKGEPMEPVTTDDEGIARIKAAIDTEVVILSMKRSDHTIVETLPRTLWIEKRRTNLEFKMKKDI
jgi:hypothetical protein